MDNIVNLLYNCGKLELSSSVFRSLYTNYPSVIIWASNNDIFITDKNTYYSNKYINDSIEKIYETYDRDIIEMIYKATSCSYCYEQEERISMLLSIINRKELKLVQVDKRANEFYNN